MEKVKVGISIGDVNGVGLEVILKTISNERILNICTPVIYGSSKVVSYHKNIVGVDDFPLKGSNFGDKIHNGKINIMNCWQDNINITLGVQSDASGKYAIQSLDYATQDLDQGKIDAIVTAPIHKKAMQKANFGYTGHTEYFSSKFKSQTMMLMVRGDLRVGLVTNHIPIKDVASTLTKELILKKLNILHKSLKVDFGIERPTIAILGLNPHAGDDGLIGEEEEKLIRPLIIESKKKGVMAMGPFPADGFFGSGQYKKFDGILAMYHDQGLVPFKALSFGEGVNYTAGLSVVRTSPDHGTAYDIAGKNEADPNSFRKAMYLAIDVVKNRKAHHEAHLNPIKRKTRNEKSQDIV